MKKVAVMVILSLVFVSAMSALSLALDVDTGETNAVSVVKIPRPDGGTETRMTVEPSESVAWKGAVTGGSVGAYIGGPVGAVIGGSIGAAIGWIFGPAD